MSGPCEMTGSGSVAATGAPTARAAASVAAPSVSAIVRVASVPSSNTGGRFGSSTTGSVSALASGPSALPRSSVKETSTLSFLPRSASTGAYVDEVAPVMGVDVAPSIRSHR